MLRVSLTEPPPNHSTPTNPQDPRDAKLEASCSEDVSSEEESSKEENEDSNNKPALTREQRRAATKAKKEVAFKKKSQKAPLPGDLSSSSSLSSSEEDDDSAPCQSKAHGQVLFSGVRCAHSTVRWPFVQTYQIKACLGAFTPRALGFARATSQGATPEVPFK
ncbi:hypothetical protein MMC28_008809 [Mycoblastus sanguinarius]|nr:hypothetical protein [Mycoblastus sanguinarius]